MRLVQLTYVSTIQNGLDPSELAKIREKANSENVKIGVSGILILGNDYFLQTLEGGRTAVNKLFTKISKDTRHSDIIILGYDEISERVFDEWGMKVLLMTENKLKSVLHFSIHNNFNPYEMSNQSALLFLKSLKGLSS